MSTKNQVNIVDEIKSRCNIVDVIGRVVPLKKSGSNFKGVCPFHNEKTPSFVVSETKQIFTCFGCGATGDVIAFVKRYYNLEFRGAVEMLAREYGISLDGAFRSNRNKDELYEINRQAARFFYKAMREKSNKGYTYMKNRGISEETMNKFGIGYADDGWTSLYDFLGAAGVAEKKMLELGLISKSKDRCFDKFRDRVIFPIINTAGKVIGFGGRIIGDGEPKYLNSQESGIFQKKNNLYGLNLARKDVSREDSIVLVEGYMDVVSLYQAGVRNVSASLGTALTENQARLIKRYTRNVVLSYDSDQAGQNAAMRGIDILYREGLRARVLRVFDGKDPDEFIRKNGRGAFYDLMDNALPYGDFKLEFAKAGYDLDDEQQKLDFLRDAVGILQSMKPVEADFYIKKLSADTGISEGAIRFEYSGNNSQEKKMPAGIETSTDLKDYEEQMPLVEQDMIKLMLLDEKFVHLPDDISDKAFRSTAGINIHRNLLAADDGQRPFDINRLKDLLDEDAVQALDMINSKIIPQGREDSIYNDCIDRIRLNELKKQENEIITRLSMADEDENGEEIVKLTKQLMDIQKKIKK
ncbi:MAG: DNA primase [Lentihominibacter sp.]|nr:DNA primase [Clostridiales bacterium]MDY2679615.1 DNA primase [Lentihominibacter sp.]